MDKKLELELLTPVGLNTYGHRYAVSNTGLFVKITYISQFIEEYKYRRVDIVFQYCRSRKYTCVTVYEEAKTGINLYKIPENIYNEFVIKKCIREKRRYFDYEEIYTKYMNQSKTKVNGKNKVQYAKELIEQGKTFKEALEETAKTFGAKDKKRLMRMLSSNLSPLFSNIELVSPDKNKDGSFVNNTQTISVEPKTNTIELGDLDIGK